VNSLAFGHDAGKKSSGQYAPSCRWRWPAGSASTASFNLDADLTEIFRRRLLDLLREPCRVGSAEISRLSRDADLAERFPSGVLALLPARWSLGSRGSEFDRRSSAVGWRFVNLLLMPG
jgi:hypothetical protein